MSEQRIERTSQDHKDFIDLVKLLDADLAIRDGEDHDFYNQFNGIDALNNVVVLYVDDVPVSCGAFKKLEGNTAEIKRMYTVEDSRGKGFGSLVLEELELWALELSYDKTLLETGVKQPEAIAMYKKNGYSITSNYGPYANVETSVCFKKLLFGAFC